MCYGKIFNYPDALKHLSSALALNDKNVEAYVLRAELNLRSYLLKSWLPRRSSSTVSSLWCGLLDLSRAIGLLQHPTLGKEFSKRKQYVRWFLNPQGPGLLEWTLRQSHPKLR
ncbi:hypothetical protein SprV_0100181000 [Sparganum proliferum]